VRFAQEFFGNDPLVPLTLDSPCATAARLFTQGVGRIPILGKNDSLVATCTPVDVLAYVDHIYQRELASVVQNEELVAESKILVRDLPQTSPIFCIPATVTARQALQTLIIEKVPVIGLLSADETLVAAFGPGSFKRAEFELLQELNKPVLKFLEEHARDNPDRNPRTVEPNETLAGVLRHLVSPGVYHVWVVDADRKPTSLITQQDVLASICLEQRTLTVPTATPTIPPPPVPTKTHKHVSAPSARR